MTTLIGLLAFFFGVVVGAVMTFGLTVAALAGLVRRRQGVPAPSTVSPAVVSAPQVDAHPIGRGPFTIKH